MSVQNTRSNLKTHSGTPKSKGLRFALAVASLLVVFAIAQRPGWTQTPTKPPGADAQRIEKFGGLDAMAGEVIVRF